MLLSQIFDKKIINVHLESEDKDEVFEELIEGIFAVHPELNRKEALDAVLGREQKMSTGIGHGIAVPHGVCQSLKGTLGALGISRNGSEYDALDNEPVYVLCLRLTDPNDHQSHLDALRRLSLAVKSPTFISTVLEKTTAADVFDTLCHYEALSAGQGDE
jgi:PTS system fructose-specific IIC component/PTS system nitrogen regulatory IIA component